MFAAYPVLTTSQETLHRKAPLLSAHSDTEDSQNSHRAWDSQMQRYLSTRDVAAFLGVSVRTLDNMRFKHRGPRYIKLGSSKASKVRYRLSDVIAWAEREKTAPEGGSRVENLAATPCCDEIRASLECKTKRRAPKRSVCQSAQRRVKDSAPSPADRIPGRVSLVPRPNKPHSPRAKAAVAPLASTRPITLDDVKFMMRYTANAIRHGHTELVGLLARLEKEYGIVSQSDPAAYAERVLKTIGDEPLPSGTTPSVNSARFES